MSHEPVKRIDRRPNVTTAAAAIALLVTVACSKQDPPAPPAPDETTLKSNDKAALGRIVEADVKVSKAMRDADDAAKVGDAGAALAIVEERAKPAVEDGLKVAAGSTMQTKWGAEKRDALSGLLRDRKDAIPKYVDAVKSSDPEKMLISVQAQASIERRALTTVAGIDENR